MITTVLIYLKQETKTEWVAQIPQFALRIHGRGATPAEAVADAVDKNKARLDALAKRSAK